MGRWNFQPYPGKVFRIGTVRYNWPMSAHASQAFIIAHCIDSEDLPYPRIAPGGYFIHYTNPNPNPYLGADPG